MLSSLLQGWGWVGTTSHVGAGLQCPTLSLLLPLRRGPSFLPLVTANGCLGRWCSSHGMMGGVSPFIPVWSMRRPLLSEALLCPRGGCRGHQGWGERLAGAAVSQEDTESPPSLQSALTFGESRGWGVRNSTSQKGVRTPSGLGEWGAALERTKKGAFQAR